MDTARGFDNDRIDTDQLGDEHHSDAGEPHVDIGTDERRMHVRAYNHWVTLLDGRAYPSIEDLDPDNIADFGPNSVLLDFTGGIETPHIQFLGRALREECALDSSITNIADVPSRSLLSRLTDHYLQIIANRAPIGFEAEFVGARGNNTLYRGILMPFSSDGDAIDFIYGVINWKEMVDAETQAKLDAEVDDSVRNAPPRHVPTAPVWADGPGSTLVEQDVVVEEDPLPPAASLADRLMLARQTAAAARAADTRSRAALYRALGRAHDFALAIDTDREAYAALLAESGIVAQDRAPMTPVVKLVFGADYDKTRLTEFATVLVHAADAGIGHGELVGFLEGVEGGIKGVVKAARAARRPAKSRSTVARARAVLDARPSLATVAIATRLKAGEYVTLLARATETGALDIVASMDGDAALTERAIRAVAG
ncbi:MAG: PAS domain-containing protein [Sphingomonas sp.]